MLEDFQNALIRLCADKRITDRFLVAPDTVLSEYCLTTKECEALLEIPREQLVRFASSLLAKRTAEFSRVVPVTKKVVPSIAAKYREWLSRNPAIATDTVLTPGQSEALRALSSLRCAVTEDESQASYAADLLTFEILSGCSATDQQIREMKSRFRRADFCRSGRASNVIPF
jgi:hypothetical protein